MLGNVLYEAKIKFTDIIGYGIKLADVLTKGPPPEGGRFDVYQVGEFKGKLTGTGKGVTYALIRPDNALVIEERWSVETFDGDRVAIESSGFGLPAKFPGVLAGKMTVHFHSSAPRYSWLNTTIGVAEARSDITKSAAEVKVYEWGSE